MHIRRRTAQLRSSSTITVQHRPPDLVKSSKKRRGFRHPPPCDEAPDPGRGDGVPICLPERDALDGEPLTLTDVPQEAHVAQSVPSEAKVLSDDHLDRSELADEHIIDEILGRLLCSLGIEGDDRHDVDADPLKQLEALLEIAKKQRGMLRPDHLCRMAVKRGDDGRQALSAGLLDDRIQRALMPEVHAVVDADGHDGSRFGQGAVDGGEHVHQP